jgi:hypothetical protein
MAARSILIAIAAFAIVFTAYRMVRIARQRPPPPPVMAQPLSEEALSAPKAEVADPSPPSADGPRYTLPEALATMPADSRNTILMRTIRDAGFACAEVIGAHAVIDAAWRVRCVDAMPYLVTVDSIGRLLVEPQSEGPGVNRPVEREIPVPPTR